ncbi:MAG TPA: nickel-type superoxide dismutase maturation protease [Pyrinomonadaceae bacterium]|jgi:nickel-type superoxide dismutase maturation protease
MRNELREANRRDEAAFNAGLREIYRVAGDSMRPTLKEGELVLMNPHAALRIGDIVVARHPFKKSVRLIKRIAEILPGERYVLLSDNLEESADSRQFGAIPAKDILGRVEARVKPGTEEN